MSLEEENRRRATRIDGHFFVRIIGVDKMMRLREGNLSATGVYFSTDQELGEIGSIERLEIKSAGGEVSAVVNACLIRRSTVQDLWEGERVCGVAFHFMPTDEVDIEGLRGLLRVVTDERLEGQNVIATSVPAALAAASEEPRSAHISGVERTGLVLHTDWPVQDGAAVQLTITEARSGEPVELTGRVRDSEVIKPGREFKVFVDISVEPVMDAVVEPRPTLGKMRPDIALVGDLERVPVDSVLNFAAFERWTGHVRLEREGEAVELALSKGALVSWTASKGVSMGGEAETVVKNLLDWSSGTFALSPGEVEGEGEDLRYWMMRAATARDHERRGPA